VFHYFPFFACLAVGRKAGPEGPAFAHLNMWGVIVRPWAALGGLRRGQLPQSYPRPPSLAVFYSRNARAS
jgi:hypothetical protein